MYIHYLVNEEKRPFSYLDFIRFEVDGKEYQMTHGTFRNNISRLIKEGLVEVSYKSNITFYTLRGVKFNKASMMTMTPDHTGVPRSSAPVPGSLSTSSLQSNPLYRILRDLPLDQGSVHDIRLRFESPLIYATIYSLISKGGLGNDHTVNARSKDILLPAWKLRDLLVKATVHRTDTVSIAVGCSLNPVSLDVNGIIRLTNALSIAEDRLSRLVERSNAFVTDDGSDSSSDNSPKDPHIHVGIIPKYSEWIVTMWHFGADASVEYSGDKFCVTWENAENVLIRAYSKLMADDRTRIRLERQEYPRTSLADAIEQKINGNYRSGG